MEYILLGLLVAGIVAAIVYGVNSQSAEQQQAEEEMRTIASSIATQQQTLRTLQAEVQRKRAEFQLEQVLVHNTLSFKALKQLHSESHRAGRAWHEVLESAQQSHDDFLTHINKLKSSRRYHAQKRTGSRGGERAYHARSGQAITLSIDGLYSALSDINNEIRQIRSQRNFHNKKTGELRDYIGANCGATGRQWYEQLMERTARRRKSLPS